MPKEYFSCAYIEGGLVFALGHLLLCCITHHGRGCPKVCDYTGGKLPIERILSFREEVRTQNQQEGRYPLCEGCGYLKRQEWEKGKYPFHTIQIAHYTKCNLQCSYCYVTREGWDGQPYEPYDLYPMIESMIREKQIDPDSLVFWGGGEPTMYRDFEKTFDLLLGDVASKW